MGKVATDTSIIALEAAGEAGAKSLVLASPAAVCWTTGHSVPIETGPSPFSGGPSLSVVGPDGTVVLVADDTEDVSDAMADETVNYVGFTAKDPEDYLANYLRAVEWALDLAGVNGVIGVESVAAPGTVTDLARSRAHALVSVDAALARARAVKTPRELALLRRSGAIAASAQEAAFAGAREGMTEIELFSLIRSRMEQDAQGRCPVAGDVLSGAERTAAVSGWPSARRLRRGDLVITDLLPRVEGYWADSCNSFTLGTPRAAQKAMYEAVSEALEAGAQAAEPGMPANVLDSIVRESLGRRDYGYTHHTGHGIGTAFHEFPRIIPGETSPLLPGMVILLEPGAYQQGAGGVRLEHMYEVTDTGLVDLTPFEHRLEAPLA